MTLTKTQTAQEGPLYLREENPWPSWLYMELSWRTSTHKDKAYIDLTINFNEEWLTTKVGRLRFGFRGGDLKVQLTNGSVPLKTRRPDNLLQPEVPKDRSISTGDKESRETGAQVGLSVKGGIPGASTEISATAGHERTNETADKLKLSDWQITSKGSSESPTWSFKTKTGKPIFDEKLIDYELGLVHISRYPCTLQARFVVVRSDIWFTGAEGFWPGSLTQNREKLIYQAVRKWVWERFQPQVSLVEVQYVQAG